MLGPDELLQHPRAASALSIAERRRLERAMLEIVRGYASRRDPSFLLWLERARGSFEARFWNAEHNMLFDVEHVVGTVDAACRPNQIFAAGGLPTLLLSPERARRVIDTVERALWTPLGLRSSRPG